MEFPSTKAAITCVRFAVLRRSCRPLFSLYNSTITANVKLYFAVLKFLYGFLYAYVKLLESYDNYRNSLNRKTKSTREYIKRYGHFPVFFKIGDKHGTQLVGVGIACVWNCPRHWTDWRVCRICQMEEAHKALRDASNHWHSCRAIRGLAAFLLFSNQLQVISESEIADANKKAGDAKTSAGIAEHSASLSSTSAQQAEAASGKAVTSASERPVFSRWRTQKDGFL